MPYLEEVNPGDNSLDDLLQSNSMDQVTEQRLDQPADSREVLVIDQRQGSLAPAQTQMLTSQHLGQTLATSVGDSDSQRNIDQKSKDEAWRDKKRKNDQNYRHSQKDKKKTLEDENNRLKQEIQEKDKEEQVMKSKLKVLEAENAMLKCELEEKKQLTKSLLDVVVKQQQTSPTYMGQLLNQIKLVVDGFVSLNQKVAEVEQYITQPPGTHVYAQPRQLQDNMLINQGSRAAATLTLPLPQLPAGTSRMQQTFQSPETFPGDSHGLPDFLLQEQLGQTAHTIDVPSEFSLHQGQGGNTAVESQPFTQGLSDLYEFLSEIDTPRLQPFCFMEKKKRVLPFTQGAQSKPFFRCVLAASLVAENDPLKLEKHELCQEDQQMKSNIEAFEAENKILKRGIKEKERQMEFNLRAFLVDCTIFRHQLQEKQRVTRNFEFDNGRLKHQIEVKERLMKSNMEACKAENGRWKLEIGEKEQPMKSNLEAFETQNDRLKREIEKEKQLMKSNLKAFEAQNGRLEHEIQAKEQLVKSNLATLEAQIRQLVEEFESLNAANVSVHLRVQTRSGELA